MRTGRPQPRCIMPDRSMRSRSWHPAQKAQSESAKEHQKSRPQITIGLISFAHKKCKTGAIGAARSSRKVRNVCTGRVRASPDASCLIVACAVAAGTQRRKRTPKRHLEEHQKQAPNNSRCHLLRTHKKYKTGALGAARSQQKVRNVRTGRPQPRCITPDRSMRSRSWHPAQKAHSESAP